MGVSPATYVCILASVMLRAGGYHGRPMPMHAQLPVEAAHFDRWLALFGVAAQETCGPAADLFIERARADRAKP